MILPYDTNTEQRTLISIFPAKVNFKVVEHQCFRLNHLIIIINILLKYCLNCLLLNRKAKTVR